MLTGEQIVIPSNSTLVDFNELVHLLHEHLADNDDVSLVCSECMHACMDLYYCYVALGDRCRNRPMHLFINCLESVSILTLDSQ